MSIAAQPMTQELAKELWDYDQETGLFFWVEAPARFMKAGDVAGCSDREGYVVIVKSCKQYRAHRLAWLYVHGRWPKDEINHIDGDRSNNRLTNLREGTRVQIRHTNGLNKNNTSGHTGVCWVPRLGKWRASYQEYHHIGLFSTAEEAGRAYKKVTGKRHGFNGPTLTNYKQ